MSVIANDISNEADLSAAAAPNGAERIVPWDVWSWSGRKYRRRAWILYSFNLLLFFVLGNFTFWLRSGLWFAPGTAGYLDELASVFRFVGEPSITLGSLLVEPIHVHDVPMQIPILGLLFAALIAIPILLAILYRLWSALPFIGIVGFIAVMPWLAITLLLSCVLAAARPLRFRFRFMTALLALVPVVVYLTLASADTAKMLEGTIHPADRIKFIAPWVLAIVVASVGFGIVLTTARLVNYRPGAITPLFVVMFALPMALFELNVGRDELYYRLLESQAKVYFAPVDATTPLREAVEHAWLEHPLPRPRYDRLWRKEEQKWQFALIEGADPYISELAQHRWQLVDRCDRFILAFPDSRYARNALFLKAQALDMRVDEELFHSSGWWIQYYDDFPDKRSQNTWETAIQNWPDSPMAAVAMLKLAQIESREGQMERASARLAALLDRFGAGEPNSREPALEASSLTRGVMERQPAETSLLIDLKVVVLNAHRLYDLLRHNRDPVLLYDPLAGSDRPHSPIRFGLLDLDPRSGSYHSNLRALRAAYPGCCLVDNLDLEQARTTSSVSERIRLLEACCLEHAQGDAAPEAIYRLGMAYFEAGRHDLGRAKLSRLVQEYPASIWAKQVLGSAVPGSMTRQGKGGA